MDIGATYLNIISYSSILLDAEGIRPILATIAVNRIDSKAAPSCLPILVLPAWMASKTVRNNMSKTLTGSSITYIVLNVRNLEEAS